MMAAAPAAVAENLTHSYPSTNDRSLIAVNWSVDAGSFNLIAGPSGSGKSTLLRCLNGLVPHFSGGQFSGRVIVHGSDTRITTPRSLAPVVGFVSQEPEAQMLFGAVQDEIAFGMEQMGVAVPVMRKRVEEVLDLLALAGLRHRDTSTLSGGERQRVAIAAALALQPELLVLDEPTSQLDPASANTVLQAIQLLHQDLGITVVLSEHRLERLLPQVQRMTVMDGGRITLDGMVEDVIWSCPLELTPPVVQLGRKLGWAPLPLTVPAARPHRDQMALNVAFVDHHQPAPGDRIVTVSNLSAGFGSANVLREINLTIDQGEIVALMGRNGSGKTTLLRSLMGLQPLRQGSIDYADGSRLRTHELGRKIGFIPQRARNLLFAETVREEVAFTARHRQIPLALIDTVLEEWELETLADRHPHDLSSGEQERVALAATLVGEPPLLLIDEPTRGMDYRRKSALIAHLKSVQARGAAVLMATHDVELVASVATRVILLGDGEFVADGPTRQVMSDSLAYSTQMNRLFGGQILTTEDVLRSVSS